MFEWARGAKRCRKHAHGRATRFLSDSSVYVPPRPPPQHYIIGKLTQECVDAVLEERGRLEDLEGAVVILTHFDFATFPRAGGGGDDCAPDIALVISSLRYIGGADNRMFGEPTAVGDEDGVRACLAGLTLAQRCARAPFLPSLSVPVTHASFRALQSGGAVPSDASIVTIVSESGITLSVRVPNAFSDLAADRTVCVPIPDEQAAALSGIHLAEPPPGVWAAEDSQPAEGWTFDTAGGDGGGDLSQLTGACVHVYECERVRRGERVCESVCDLCVCV